MKQSDKKVSFDDSQKRGHFSCRKPVSHVGTSTVSDSEAPIHLAYVQHLWQSKLVVILEGLTRLMIELCSKMQLAGKWLQMHFDLHVCLLEKTFCYAALTAKPFVKFAPFLDPKMGVENGPKNGAGIWPPKSGPKMAPKRGTQYFKQSFDFLLTFFRPNWASLLGSILGLHFGGQIPTPFLGPFFNSHFEVQKWCKFCKSFCCQSCIAKLFPANKHAYQDASVIISRLIASLNTIQSSTWSSLPK